MTKHILYFIGLKCMEIVAVGGILSLSYYTGLGWHWIGVFPEMDSVFGIIMGTLLGIPAVGVAIIIPVAIGYVIYLGVKKNWEWAGKLKDKYK